MHSADMKDKMYRTADFMLKSCIHRETGDCLVSTTSPFHEKETREDY
jgi:hypothetical protein